jgi:signal peptidase I
VEQETKNQDDEEKDFDEIDPEQGSLKAVGSFVWELAKVFLYALLIIVPLRVFIAEPFIVSGSSMVPNFHNREYLIVDKVTYRFSEPERGDVIIFKYPKDPKQYFIKRIIGLPGDTVLLRDGGVTIYNKDNPQGQKLDEQYLPDQRVTSGSEDPVTLGSEEYYVMGDNRQASSDSRFWGVLPKFDFVGKVSVRVFPLSNFSIIKGFPYNF